MPNRLQNKVCLITGAGSGLGKATAIRFANEGATVISATRNKISSEDILNIRLDVTSESDWIQAIDTIKQQFSRLDVLINNAGIGMSGPIVSFSLENWRRLMAVNLDGVFLGTKHALPLMAKQGGSIVNIASIDGINGVPNASAYCASKAGVCALSKAVALECAEAGIPVRVNTFCPGSFHSPMVEKAEGWPEQIEKLGGEQQAKNARAQYIPLRRLASYDELVNGILFLASDESSYMTGSELIIDGGVTAR